MYTSIHIECVQYIYIIHSTREAYSILSVYTIYACLLYMLSTYTTYAHLCGLTNKVRTMTKALQQGRYRSYNIGLEQQA